MILIVDVIMIFSIDFFYNNLFFSMRRAPNVLSLRCGVCQAPAPNHLHFGGKGTTLANGENMTNEESIPSIIIIIGIKYTINIDAPAKIVVQIFFYFHK